MMIHIACNISDLKSFIPKDSKVFVIIDSNLSSYYYYFEGYQMIPLDVSEEKKTFSTVESIVYSLMEKGADRDAFILGVGGGITTDIVGFVAAIYKRGVRCAFVPTTLLAEVDASIGGKNGVNVHSYKNMIGVIRQPEWVFIAPQFLSSLPQREFNAGLAELLKTFIIFDKNYYHKSVELFRNKKEDLLSDHLDELIDVIKRCAHYKMEVVERDEFENGERRLLNLGHTFAHAIEKYSKTGIIHGEAVLTGIIMAAKVANVLNLSNGELAEQLMEDFEKLNLPMKNELSKEEFIDAVTKDKKKSGSQFHLILPIDLGKVEDVILDIGELMDVFDELY